MESPNSTSGLGHTAITIGAGFISISHVQAVVSILAGLISIIAGVFAIRHYIIQYKKLKKEA